MEELHLTGEVSPLLRPRRPWELGLFPLVLLVVILVGAAGAAAVILHPWRGQADSVAIPPRLAAEIASLPAPPAALPLSAGWHLRLDPQGVGEAEGWERQDPAGAGWSPVTLPQDFNSLPRPVTRRGTVAWYATTFTGPADSGGRGWQVAFESVRRHATVWLNGRRLGTSADPYAPFSFPAAGLRAGAANLLVVRVDNLKTPSSLPEDWWNWGGIMGPVALRPLGRLSLGQLEVIGRPGCGLRCGAVEVQGQVVNHLARALGGRVVVQVRSPQGQLVAVAQRRLGPLPAHGSDPVDLTVPLRGAPALWAPEHPSLYRVQVDLDGPGQVEQRAVMRTGLRSVSVRNGLLLLNGRRLWLHGAAIHEDVAGRGAALTDADIATIVSQLKAVGANVTRAHYLLSPRLLDALDAAGIMVWAQPPVDHAVRSLQSSAGRAHALALLRSTVLGDRSHPSVLLTSVGNELTPTPDSDPGTAAYLRQAIATSRRLAPELPVALDTYCYPGFPAQRIYGSLDVLGISSYFGWYQGIPGHPIGSFTGLAPFLRLSHQRYPRQALVVSEYGAEGLYPGPATVKGSYAFQADYLRRTVQTVAGLPFMNGTIYWTLREFAVAPGWTGGATLLPGREPDGIHHKGLIAYDGAPKPAYAVAARVLRDAPPG